MKKIFLLAVLVFTANIILAQTVENIRVEQDGENLNIHYRIGGSTSEQLYFVTLTCSIDGGPVFEPKSVIGDVGANIRGGKSFNTVVWDVFEDVEEVGSVEFFVKVDLTSDEEEIKEVAIESMQEIKATRNTDPDKMLIGIYAGAGAHSDAFKPSIGVDFVKPLSEKFAIGAFGGYQYRLSMTTGVNMMIGNYREKTAVFYGIGSNLNSTRYFFTNRLGIRSAAYHMYGFVEVSVGMIFIGSLMVGYSF